MDGKNEKTAHFALFQQGIHYQTQQKRRFLL
jgi:hypothetical protein